MSGEGDSGRSQVIFCDLALNVMQYSFHCVLFIEAATEASPVARRGEADFISL